MEKHFEESRFDVVLCDYVLEHIENPDEFFRSVNLILKPGGWFVARTPHKFHYVSLVSQFLNLANNFNLLRYLQPGREEKDVFPAFYRMNTQKGLQKLFSDYDDYSFIYRTEPSYFFGSKLVFFIQKVIHFILPHFLIGNLFVFLNKKK